MVKCTWVPVEQEDFDAAMERFKIMEDNIMGSVFFWQLAAGSTVGDNLSYNGGYSSFYNSAMHFS